MRKKALHTLLLGVLALLLSSCSVGRFVPEGKYFLDKNTVEIEGEEVEFTKSEVSSYITQKPHKVRFPSKFTTWLYYVTEDNDGSGFRHWMHEHFGREPVYFDPAEIGNSARQMEQYLDNRGYFHSRITTHTEYKGYRAKVTYTVHPATPYHIANID